MFIYLLSVRHEVHLCLITMGSLFKKWLRCSNEDEYLTSSFSSPWDSICFRKALFPLHSSFRNSPFQVTSHSRQRRCAVCCQKESITRSKKHAVMLSCCKGWGQVWPLVWGHQWGCSYRLPSPKPHPQGWWGIQPTFIVSTSFTLRRQAVQLNPLLSLVH